MKKHAPANMQLVIRTVPSLLSLPYYSKLIDWCWRNEFPMDNSVLVWPTWLRASMLSSSIKEKIIEEANTAVRTTRELKRELQYVKVWCVVIILLELVVNSIF